MTSIYQLQFFLKISIIFKYILCYYLTLIGRAATCIPIHIHGEVFEQANNSPKTVKKTGKQDKNATESRKYLLYYSVIYMESKITHIGTSMCSFAFLTVNLVTISQLLERLHLMYVSR